MGRTATGGMLTPVEVRIARHDRYVLPRSIDGADGHANGPCLRRRTSPDDANCKRIANIPMERVVRRGHPATCALF